MIVSFITSLNSVSTPIIYLTRSLWLLLGIELCKSIHQGTTTYFCTNSSQFFGQYFSDFSTIIELKYEELLIDIEYILKSGRHHQFEIVFDFKMN